MNRLNLNFSLVTADERKKFVEEYLQRDEFIKRPPNADELETIANYLLYGKNPETGLNAVQEKTVQIATKHGTWDNTHETESLDELIEQPTFNEATITTNLTHYTHRSEKFSRQEALNLSDERQAQQFQELFDRIDKLDLAINLYEVRHGKREAVRAELVKKIDNKELRDLEEKITHWSAYKYLKQRHNLVEMRREQYTMRDSLVTPITRHSTLPLVQVQNKLDWDADIQVLPLGLMGNRTGLVFRDKEHLRPDGFTEDELKQISEYYWAKKQDTEHYRFSFDFRDLENVYQLFLAYFELEDETEEENVEGNLGALLKTLMYYVDCADLIDVQREILDMKIKRIKNQTIADTVNKKYNKNYTANYISTIFRQKIIPQINAAAAQHEQIIGNIWFPEEFKTCSCCGRTYLRTADYFVRKSRSSDGLSSRCKKCDKKEREEKKLIHG